MACFSYAAGGDRNMNRSWPFCAETSAAARALISPTEMWSTRTSVSCLSPHCLQNVPSNHLSYPGTKWLHWMILSVFRCARTRRGASALPATPAASAAPPAACTKRRRVIVFFAILGLLGGAVGARGALNGAALECGASQRTTLVPTPARERPRPGLHG